MLNQIVLNVVERGGQTMTFTTWARQWSRSIFIFEYEMCVTKPSKINENIICQFFRCQLLTKLSNSKYITLTDNSISKQFDYLAPQFYRWYRIYDMLILQSHHITVMIL